MQIVCGVLGKLLAKNLYHLNVSLRMAVLPRRLVSRRRLLLCLFIYMVDIYHIHFFVQLGFGAHELSLKSVCLCFLERERERITVIHDRIQLLLIEDIAHKQLRSLNVSFCLVVCVEDLNRSVEVAH